MQLKLSENIKLLRNRKGITQDTLAEKMKVTVQAVSKWETGNSCPEISILPDLAEFFGVTVDDLLTGSEPRMDAADSTVPMTYFPDDDVYRVAEFLGSHLLKTDEGDDRHKIVIDISELDKKLQSNEKLLVNIMGSAEIEGDVKGSVNAEGYVECGPVGDSVNAGEYVVSGPVGGSVTAAEYVVSGPVGDSVNAGEYVECGDVGGDVYAGNNVTCSNIGGSIHAGDGNVQLSMTSMGTAQSAMDEVYKGLFGNGQPHLKKNPMYKHPMTYVCDLGAAGRIRFHDNTGYGDSTISTRQVCVDFSSFIWDDENPPEIGDTVRVTGKLLSPIDIDKMLVGIVDDSREPDYWLALDKDGENYLKQNTYVCGLKAGEPFEMDVSLSVKQNVRRAFKVQLAYGEQNGGCVTMEAYKAKNSLDNSDCL